MKPTNLIILTLAASFAAITSALAQDGTLPPASTKTGVTYARDIQPIFETACVKCHGAEKPKARLRMDTLEGVLKGTKQEKIIVVGDSAKSLLVKSVAHLTRDRESWMPPLRNKAGIKPLTPEQIGLVRAWIDQGAK
ncbi:MAG: c-type cytochrome domain-containing protein [Verrucomicrobiota bacterium]